MERTLVIIKPGAVQRGIAGEVISRFEKKGLKLVAMKMYRMTKEKCAEHYAHLLERPFYPEVEASMMRGPVILCCWEGFEAVEVVRSMTGVTNCRKAAPGTIRGDFGMSGQENIIHTSDSPENAVVELDRFFAPEDYFPQEYLLEAFTYAGHEH